MYSGNDGVLFNIPLIVPDDAEGDYVVRIDNFEMATPAEVAFYCEPIECKVSVMSYIKGDVNGDGKVSITDVTSVANGVLGNASSSFIFGAADMNEDGKITVTDVTAVANVILNTTVATSLECNNGNSAIFVDDFQIAAGQSKTLAINLNNADDFTAFQMDINLPEGLKNKNCGLTSRSNKHALLAKTFDDGRTRVVSYSLENNNYRQNDGALLMIEVEADDKFAGGELTIENIAFADRYENEAVLESVYVQADNSNNSIDAIESGITISTQGKDIVICTPFDAIAVITQVNGISKAVEIKSGNNVIPVDKSGIYIVTVNNMTTKVIIK